MSYDPNLWNAVLAELRNDPTRVNEMNSKKISCQNNQSLRWYEKVYGSPSSGGYALFICLHGGGQGSASMNDGQWKDIIPFENGGFQNGTIAVACRGITNTWNLHFVNESYPAITRLIEDYIIFRGVDPNRVYIMGFSAGGDGTYALSERLPHLLAACSPQGGHPNGVSTINLCNCPIYMAAGEKDSAFKRNQVCVEYYNKIMAQNGKYLGNYIAKVEVVGGSPHSFQCWKVPRKSYFNGSKSLSQTNETAFTFMYSHTRNPHPTDISLDTKTFLTPLRNYYTPRGNTFYNIELGRNPSPIIQVQINYNNNVITVKEGTNFKLNLVSSLFRGGDVVTVVAGGKSTQYRLQRDANYAKNNMKLFCDPNYGYDSYITIGNFQPEVNVGYLPQPAQPVSQASQSQAYPQVIPSQAQYQQQMAGYQMAYQQPYGQYQQVYPGMQYGYGQNQYLNYGYGRQQYGYQRYW
jgi:poly(3-hydroxybutyrate) depolymerase